MADSNIYANADEPSGYSGKGKSLPGSSESIYANEDIIQTLELHTTGPVHSGGKDIKRTSCRIPAVCLGLLCFLLLIGVITLISQNFKDKSKYNSNMVNLTAARDQLQTSYNNLKAENDQLQVNYFNLTKERDELQKKSLDDMNKLRSGLRSQLQDRQGWVYFGGSFYYVSSVKKSWHHSRADCQSRGAHLIIINSKEEQNFMRGLKKTLWIGLTDSEREGVWKWVDGTPLTKSYWATGEPNSYQGTNEDCSNIKLNNEENNWNDLGCDASEFWICERTFAL